MGGKNINRASCFGEGIKDRPIATADGIDRVYVGVILKRLPDQRAGGPVHAKAFRDCQGFQLRRIFRKVVYKAGPPCRLTLEHLAGHRD